MQSASILKPLCCILVISFLFSCSWFQPKEVSRGEILHASAFRLSVAPEEVVQRQHHYLNRGFLLPSYRNPQGGPLAGWRCQLVPTRRFFTDQSARIYYRTEDLEQTRRFKSLTPAGGTHMTIWPVGTIFVLETYAKGDASRPGAKPTAVDCTQKFPPEPDHFPANTFFSGDWSYQRFDSLGDTKEMVGGASACHQCHLAAFHLTGDLVFTVFSDDAEENGCN